MLTRYQELIWFGLQSNLNKLTQAVTSLQLGSTIIEPAAVVLNVGVYMDIELNMEYTSARWQQFVSFIFVVFANIDLF